VVDVGDVIWVMEGDMCLVFQYENWEGTEFPYLRGVACNDQTNDITMVENSR
jgi:hypothetical protein